MSKARILLFLLSFISTVAASSVGYVSSDSKPFDTAGLSGGVDAPDGVETGQNDDLSQLGNPNTDHGGPGSNAPQLGLSNVNVQNGGPGVNGLSDVNAQNGGPGSDSPQLDLSNANAQNGGGVNNTNKPKPSFSLSNAGSALITGAADIDIKLPTGEYGLFVSNSAPAHPYLIESNPQFTRKENFISSAYMMERLDLDGDKLIKRLGDAIYENNLIRQQIFAQVGRHYLSGHNTDLSQYKHLMNNGLAAQKNLNLKPGVALSKDQINRLTVPSHRPNHCPTDFQEDFF